MDLSAETAELAKLKAFYDSQYYGNRKPPTEPSRHLRKLARRLRIASGHKVLDVACGFGTWLLACRERGAEVAGIDLSEVAIGHCRQAIPEGSFYAGSAERLPFPADSFDCITCLGSLEHFVDPIAALREMVRVGTRDACIVLLVPNAGFLTRRLGLFQGTEQTEAKEEVRSLAAWQALFAEAGLETLERWPDWHVVSGSWITAAPWYLVPFRATQAVALLFWPLEWQYQVYHLCGSKR